MLGRQVDFREDDGLCRRAGARVGGQFNLLGSNANFYVGGNYVRTHEGEPSPVLAETESIPSQIAVMSGSAPAKG